MNHHIIAGQVIGSDPASRLAARLYARASEGDIAGALEDAAALVTKVGQSERARARVFLSESLDRALMKIGRLGSRFPANSGRTDRSAWIVTALGATGGHSRILGDLMQADPSVNRALYVTNVRHSLTKAQMERLSAGGAAVYVAPDESLDVRLAWLKEQLAEFRPCRTYLMHHPFDSVAVAAAQPELTGQLIFYHHNDHTLTLGGRLAHAIHVDTHAKGFHHCRDVEGIAEIRWWPTTVTAPTRVRAPSGKSNLKTACAGGDQKFATGGNSGVAPYPVCYPDMVRTVVQTTHGFHLHIGPLPETTIIEIEDKLLAAKVPVERFVHLPYAPSLSDALCEHGVDIYLGSMPLGGGRATVEALSCGLPVVVHRNYRSGFLTDYPDLYPGAMGWRTLDDLEALLVGLTPEVRAEHAARAYAWYLERHTPDELRRRVAELVAGRPSTEPCRRTYDADELARFLDESTSTSLDPEVSTDNASDENEEAPANELLQFRRTAVEIPPGNRLVFTVEQARRRGESLGLTGWALGDPRIDDIVIYGTGIVDNKVTLSIPRSDVNSAFPEFGEVDCGFQTAIQLDRSSASREITVEFRTIEGEVVGRANGLLIDRQL